MATGHSTADVAELYRSVINEVVNNVREAFLDEECGDDVLNHFKKEWEAKVKASKRVDWDGPARNAAQVTKAKRETTVAAARANMQQQNATATGTSSPSAGKSTTKVQPVQYLGGPSVGVPMVQATQGGQMMMTQAGMAAHIALPAQLAQQQQQIQQNQSSQQAMLGFQQVIISNSLAAAAAAQQQSQHQQQQYTTIMGGQHPGMFQHHHQQQLQGMQAGSIGPGNVILLQQGGQAYMAATGQPVTVQPRGARTGRAAIKSEIPQTDGISEPLSPIDLSNDQPCSSTTDNNNYQPPQNQRYMIRNRGASSKAAAELPQQEEVNPRQLRQRPKRTTTGAISKQDQANAPSSDGKKKRGRKSSITQLDGVNGLSDSSDSDDDDDDDGMDEDEEDILREAMKQHEGEDGDEEGGEGEDDDEPLNSDDDESEEGEDVEQGLDTGDNDNVVMCQFDKIHRARNRWKFVLKDGIMQLDGKDYAFNKAQGEAEW